MITVLDGINIEVTTHEMSNSMPFPLFNYQGKKQFKHKQHQEKKNISSNRKHQIKNKLFKEK